MVWDDDKSAGDLIQSSEWDAMVTDQKGRVVGTSVNEVIADTAANLPAAGTSGRLFFETDTGRVLYDNGTSWVEVGLSESQISGANINDNTVTVGSTSITLGSSGVPDVTEFSGSTGTNGQFLQTDGSSLSFADVSGGMTTQERQAFNDLVAQLARNDFEDNLDGLNYDGGFYEILRDKSKINVLSSTKTTVQETDGFEDGDFTSNPTWQIDGGTENYNIQQSVVARGDYAFAGDVPDSNNSAWLYYDRGTGSVSDGDIYQAFIRVTAESVDNRAWLNIANGIGRNAPDLIGVRFTGVDVQLYEYDSNGDYVGSTSTNVDPSIDTWYRVQVEINPSVSEATLRVYDNSGNLLDSVTRGTSGASNLQYVSFGNQKVTTDTVYFDDVSYDAADTEELEFNTEYDLSNVSVTTLKDGDPNGTVELASDGSGGFETSGYVRSTQFDLTNKGLSTAPSTVVPSQEVTLNGQDINYVLEDADGNTTTITQSDVDTEVDISGSITSPKIQIKMELSGDGTDTPVLDDEMFHFKE